MIATALEKFWPIKNFFGERKPKYSPNSVYFKSEIHYALQNEIQMSGNIFAEYVIKCRYLKCHIHFLQKRRVFVERMDK